jgi:hypothetical protein
MSSTYAGANAFPASFTIPDDGDAENASTVNVPLEALADRTVYLQQHSPRLTTQEYTTPGSYTWVAPTRVTKVRVRGIGGGGSGGAGTGGGGGTNQGGGSGGGGAKQAVAEVAVVPGSSYTVTVAAGGTSPTTGDGHDGGDSSFAGVTTVTFYGAGGGGTGNSPGGPAYGVGGPPLRNGVPIAPQAAIGLAPPEGQGGWSATSNTAPAATTAMRTGGHSAVARGGAPGVDHDPTGVGTWAGAGGGASGYAGNVPGTGGAGGLPGLAGGAGVAGTLGAGGGGGGGSAVTGGAGGAGGNGAITLSWTDDS